LFEVLQLLLKPILWNYDSSRGGGEVWGLHMSKSNPNQTMVEEMRSFMIPHIYI
jgi:hypothetical protein